MNTLKNNVQSESEIKKRSWTEEDKDNLVKLYPYKTNKELCKILEKSDGQLRWMKSQLGLNTKFKPFTDDEKSLIEQFYKNNPDNMDLDSFAKSLGRQKTSISRYARKIGLTKYGREKSVESIEKFKFSLNKYHETTEYINEIKPKQIELLNYYAKYDHPKGMLNKHHTRETCEQLSKSHIILFENMTDEEKHRRAMKAVETKRKNGKICTTTNSYSRCKGGFRDDLHQYFRSAWEANVARVLNYLRIDWKYEYKRFNFDEQKENVLSYQPDFYLPEYNKWIEVKGWMDDISKKRLELFSIYYPDESLNLILVDEKQYNLLKSQYEYVIDNWE